METFWKIASWRARRQCLHMLAALALLLSAPGISYVQATPCLGRFQVLNDIGISPITATQSIDGLLYLLDRSDLKNSKLIVNGTAEHAVEYNPVTNKFRAIRTATNTWCSAGGYLHDATILNMAGSNSGGGRGLQACRTLRPCSRTLPVPPLNLTNNITAPCNEWYENPKILSLNKTRWYPTAQVLPDRSFFLMGGSTGCAMVKCNISSYEFVRPWVQGVGPAYDFPFIRRSFPNYLYPFVHLLPSDLLFIFANKNGTIFDYKTHKEVALVPDIPDGMSRSYPSTGSSVLLPLTHLDYEKAEILICGGNTENAGPNTPAAKTCFRIDVSKNYIDRRSLRWQGVEMMARGRVMGDMLYLLDGTVVIINGCQLGVAGFALGKKANLAPEIYDPFAPFGFRIKSENMCNSTILRGYHSEAILLTSGRVFISGSNPWGGYFNSTMLPGQQFLSEFRVESWTPPHLLTTIPRPERIGLPFGRRIAHRQNFTITFTFRTSLTTQPNPPPDPSNVHVGFISGSVTTHSLSMNLRYLQIRILKFDVTFPYYTMVAAAPPKTCVAPDGFYMLTVVYNGVPSIASWVQIIG